MALAPGVTPQAREAARKATMARAEARALALAPLIAEIRASGITTPYAIAAALTARGIRTAHGHRVWTDKPVRNLLKRLDRQTASLNEGLLTPEPSSSTRKSPAEAGQVRGR
jgi:hypothetical protein